MDNKYSNSKIYKICDVGYNKTYIGSTCEKLSKRFARHRHAYRRYLLGNFNKITIFSLFDEYGADNCKIELIENFECENREKLCQREGYYIKNMECVNKNIAGRTKQEYDKQYYLDNKENRKQYYLDNKDSKQEYYKQYYLVNKELINEKHNEKNTLPNM